MRHVIDAVSLQYAAAIAAGTAVTVFLTPFSLAAMPFFFRRHAYAIADMLLFDVIDAATLVAATL